MALRLCPVWALVLLVPLWGACQAQSAVSPPLSGPDSGTPPPPGTLSEGEALKLQCLAFDNGSQILTAWDVDQGEPCPNDTAKEYSSSWQGVTCLGLNVMAL